MLELMFEQAGVARFGIPVGLAALYGGDLGFAAPRLYANFVSSVDGVVALREGGNSGSIISGRSEADRFVMGLLRACASAVLIGAGTFRATPGHLWNAEQVHPAGAALFGQLRRQLGLEARPLLVVVSASGEVDTSHPALREAALIVTTAAGEARLRGKLPPATRLIALGSVSLPAVIEAVRAEGHQLILTEGGPTLAGRLIAEGLLDELFLTVAPSLFGRSAGDGRKELLEGVDLARSPRSKPELLSARRHGSMLFLRYALGAR